MSDLELQSLPLSVVAGELSENRLAEMFVLNHSNYRYVAKWGRWYRWNGTVWEQDSTHEVWDAIRRSNNEITTETRWRNAGTVTAVERYCKADRAYAATDDQWDQDDWLLNTPGGTIDLKTGETHENNPQDYITKSTIAALDITAPMWARFLDEITHGDKAYQAYLQRAAGYCATGETREHALFFGSGPGANGKGVFARELA